MHKHHKEFTLNPVEIFCLIVGIALIVWAVLFAPKPQQPQEIPVPSSFVGGDVIQTIE